MPLFRGMKSFYEGEDSGVVNVNGKNFQHRKLLPQMRAML